MTEVPLTWNNTLGDYSRWVNFKRPDLPPGAAQWRKTDAGVVYGLMYCCPCGCQDWRMIGVIEGPPKAHFWAWDGNETAPTLSPSIKHMPPPQGGCSWHGHLEVGIWRGEIEDVSSG